MYGQIVNCRGQNLSLSHSAPRCKMTSTLCHPLSLSRIGRQQVWQKKNEPKHCTKRMERNGVMLLSGSQQSQLDCKAPLVDPVQFNTL